jgi:dihydroorotase
MTTRITIRKPDDWHLHVRDGEMLKAVLPYTAKHFGRAILMPNLIPPVRTTADCAAYRERVMAAIPRMRSSSRCSLAISPTTPIPTTSSAAFATGCSPA